MLSWTRLGYTARHASSPGSWRKITIMVREDLEVVKHHFGDFVCFPGTRRLVVFHIEEGLHLGLDDSGHLVSKIPTYSPKCSSSILQGPAVSLQRLRLRSGRFVFISVRSRVWVLAPHPCRYEPEDPSNDAHRPSAFRRDFWVGCKTMGPIKFFSFSFLKRDCF